MCGMMHSIPRERLQLCGGTSPKRDSTRAPTGMLKQGRPAPAISSRAPGCQAAAARHPLPFSDQHIQVQRIKKGPSWSTSNRLQSHQLHMRSTEGLSETL